MGQRLEILTHPKDGDCGLKEVYRVFEEVDWRTEACTEKVYECYEGRQEAEAQCPETQSGLLALRKTFPRTNDYLHGNQLSDDRLVVKSTGKSMFMYTQSLYRLLLTGFLGLDYYGPVIPKEAGNTPYDRVGTMNFRFVNRRGERAGDSPLLKPKDNKTKASSEAFFLMTVPRP